MQVHLATVVPRTLRVVLVLLSLVTASACSKDNTITGTTGPSGPFNITGTVRDSSGAPVVGATVTIVGGPNSGSTTKTAANGTYGFNGLQAAGFVIKVTSSQWAPTQVVMTLPGDLVADVVMTLPPFVLTGQVLNADTSAPISGAAVSINGRYPATSDKSGRYSDTGGLDAGSLASLHNYVWASANGYESEYRLLQTTSLDFHLRPIQRITAGASTSITVSPTDTMCVNNAQDEPILWGSVFPVCRTVRVTAPSNGMLTVEVTSSDGAHPQVEVEPAADIGNPWSQFVTTGTEITVNVEIQSNSGTSKTFLVHTSLSPANTQARRR